MDDYPKYRDKMTTGDIIAFSGTSKVSRIIQWKTNSIYSHIGLVVNVDMQGGIGKSVLVMESSSQSTTKDMNSKVLLRGVQMSFLSKRVHAYDGGIWWAPLKHKLSEHKKNDLQRWLRSKQYIKTPYSSLHALGAKEELLNWIPGIDHEPDFASLFSADLVTKALQIVGLVDSSLYPAEQTPNDVMKQSCVGTPIHIWG